MTGSGLAEVANPSALFLSERGQPVPGSAVFAGIEGTRPVLTEVQALVAPSTLASPRRTVVGLDSGRVSTILAVLEARCGIPFAGLDVFLNVAGGMRVSGKKPHRSASPRSAAMMAQLRGSLARSDEYEAPEEPGLRHLAVNFNIRARVASHVVEAMLVKKHL